MTPEQRDQLQAWKRQDADGNPLVPRAEPPKPVEVRMAGYASFVPTQFRKEGKK